MDLTEIAIYLSKDKKTFKVCARLMAGSEPWKTLKREFEECLTAFSGVHKELYVATEKNTIVGFVILQMTGTFKGYFQPRATSSNIIVANPSIAPIVDKSVSLPV